MKFKPRRILVLVTGGALAAGGGAAAWKMSATRGQIRAALPPAPAVAARPEEFRTRLATAQARAAGWGGAAAFGELSRLYHANGFLREAMQCYAALETLEPAEPRWLHRHAALLAGFGEAEPAITRWDRVRTLAPEYWPAQLRLGDLFLKTNRTVEAVAAFAAVLRREADQPHALFGLARLDLDAGRWTEARTKLETVVTKTRYALGYDLIVTVHEHFGDLERAAEIRGRAKASGAYRDAADPWLDELANDCYDVYRLALDAGLAARSGDPATARRLLERAVSLAPDDPAVRFQLAGVLTERHDLVGARRELERCTQINPAFSDAWAHWAALLQQAGDTAGAARLVAAGLQKCPDSAGLHLMRARQLRDSGRPTEAIAAFQAAIGFRPNEADAYLELATTLFRLERVGEGVPWLERGLAAEPEHPPTLALLALHAIGTGDPVAARGWMERVHRQPRVPAEQVAKLRAAFQAQFGRTAP